MSCSVSSDHEREIALADALEPQHNLDRAAGTLAAHLGALPSDLGMLIVQMAATMDYQSAICWTVVSKTFRKWVDPILYHTVWLKNCGKCEDFLDAITSRQDRAFFQRTVKVLSIDVGCSPECGYWDTTSFEPMYSSCTGISSFICRGPVFSAQMAIFISSCKRLRRLYIGTDIPSEALRHLTGQFDNLTHLSFSFPKIDDAPMPFLDVILSSVPNLTHVACEGPSTVLVRAVNVLRRFLRLPRVRTLVHELYYTPESLDEEQNRVLVSLVGNIAKGIHSDYGVCIMRADAYNGCAPHTDGSVSRVGTSCTTFGSILHLPEELDLWQVADQVTSAQMQSQKELLEASRGDLRYIETKLADMRKDMKLLAGNERWMENNRQVYETMRQCIRDSEARYVNSQARVDKIVARFLQTWIT